MDNLLVKEDLENIEVIFYKIYLNYKSIYQCIKQTTDTEIIELLEEILNSLYCHLTTIIKILNSGLEREDESDE